MDNVELLCGLRSSSEGSCNALIPQHITNRVVYCYSLLLHSCQLLLAMESNAIVVKEAIVVIIVALRYYFELHLSCISMAGLHQRADNGRRSCSAPPPENQELSASLQQCNNPVTGKVHFTPKVFSVMHSMHHNAIDECILSS